MIATWVHSVFISHMPTVIDCYGYAGQYDTFLHADNILIVETNNTGVL